MQDDIKFIKKQISNDWTKSINQLHPYTQSKFYKVVGNIILGIEGVNIPNINGYKPHLVIYPLWKENIVKCLENPSVYLCLLDNKGFQYSIPYLKHQLEFKDVMKCVLQQFPILFDDRITLTSVNDLVNKLLDDQLVLSNSAQQAKLLELKFYTALYVGNEKQISNVFIQIEQKRSKWNPKLFEIWYGNYEFWLQGLRSKMENRMEFLEQIDKNRNDKKIAKLKFSEIE